MTDITKCQGIKHRSICSQKDSCWRYTAPEGSWQSYFVTAPFGILKDGKTECEYFWDQTSEIKFYKKGD